MAEPDPKASKTIFEKEDFDEGYERKEQYKLLTSSVHT